MRIFEDGSVDHMFIPQADPYMLKGEDGRYYLYVTGGQMFSSEKLKIALEANK